MNIENDVIPTNEKQDSTSQTAALFVSLYVVILAFFIVLTSNAQYDVEKSKKVMDSVNRAFSTEQQSMVVPVEESVGQDLSVTQMLDSLRETVSSELELQDTQILQEDGLLQLTIPVTALYNENQFRLRTDRDDLLKRVSASLKTWREKQLFSIRIMHGMPVSSSATLDSAALLEIRRMGLLARYFENEGVPPALLNVGVLQGQPDEIILTFQSEYRGGEQQP